MRAKRPPMLSFLLRWATLRRVARVVIAARARPRRRLPRDLHGAAAEGRRPRAREHAASAFQQTRNIVAFACLVTVLLFARSNMYSDRGERPGFARILATLFQVTVVALLFALDQRRSATSAPTTSSTARSSSRCVYVGIVPLRLRGGRRACCCGRPATAAARCSSARARHVDAVARALGAGPAPGGRGRRLGVRAARTAARRIAGHARGDRRARSTRHRVDEVDHRRPRLPRAASCSSSSTARTRAACACASRPRRWRCSSTAPSSCPGQSVPLFELRPPVFEGLDFVAQAHLRPRSVATLGLIVLSPLLALIALAIKLSSRGPVLYRSMRPGMGGVAVRVPEVPHDGGRRRSPPARPRGAQRGQRRALQDARGPAPDRRRAPAAPLLARRAAAAAQRAARRDVAGRPAPAAPARLRSPRGRGTRSATW